MTSQARDVIVIGGGANGLVAAAALARAGRKVLLLERGEVLGGQGRMHEFAPGFRAPVPGTDQGWLPDSVARGLGLREMARVTPEYALAVAGPAEALVVPCDPKGAWAALRRLSERDATRWPDFIGQLHRLARFLGEVYQLPAPDIDTSSLGELLPLAGLARKFRGLGRKDMIEFLRVMPMAVQELAGDWFESDLLLAGITAGGVQDIRQGPRSGGTAFVLLHHLIGAPAGGLRNRGSWLSGPDGFLVAAEQAARAAGVEIRTGAGVHRIAVRDDMVTGVVLDGGAELAATTVLTTTDPARTFLQLVDPVWLDPDFLLAVRNIKFRGATSYLLFALDGLPARADLPEAALRGPVSLTPGAVALERAYDASKYGEISAHPHIELHVPSLTWPGLAPAGRQVMVAKVQWTPHTLRDGEWNDARRAALTDRVTRLIGEVLPGFADRVLHRETLTPRDLELRFGLTEGATNHGELTLDQILFMRPVPGWGDHRTPIGGLYQAGAGTHPGPGVLGGPGWLAAKRVLNDKGGRP